MSMKYIANLHFFIVEKEKNGDDTLDIPINSFEVDGGASGYVDINSTDDIGIFSELIQARDLQNITLFIPPTNSANTEIGLTLAGAAVDKLPLNILLTVRRYTRGKLLEGLGIMDREATLKYRPHVVGKRLLMIELILPAAMIIHGMMFPKAVMKNVKIV